MKRRGTLLLLVLTASMPLRAQTVGGRLVARSGSPVEGAFLVLIDEAGTEVGRVLTGQAGTFLLKAPVPGTYRLRSKRIGFKMWESEPMMLADGATTHFLLEVDALPVTLPPVVIPGTPQCATRGEAGSVVA